MPLTIPETYHIYRLISIDPGTLHTGVAIYDVDMLNNKIKYIDAFTFHSEIFPNITGLDNEYVEERIIKLHKIRFMIHELVGRLKPRIVVCESPFYSAFRPSAYGALLETIAYIRSAIIEVDPSIFFKTVEPLVIKKYIGAGFTKGKINMRECVQSNTEIMSILKNDIASLDEHSIDAIACGYCFIKNSGILV